MTTFPAHAFAPRLLRALGVLTVIGVLAVSCGGDDSSSPETTEPARSTTTTEAGGDDGDGGEPETASDEERKEAVDDFEEDVRSDIGQEDLSGGTAYDSYMTVQDDSGLLSVDVPDEWSDVNGEEGLFGPDVSASVSLQQFFETFDVPGVEFQATTLSTQTPTEVLGELASGFVSLCEAGPTQPYADPLYTGVSQLYLNCDGTGTTFAWVAVEPADQSFIAVVGVQIVTDRDIAALGTILDTFVVNA